MGNRSRKKSTCYMCSAVATSREHVPPSCFFPEDENLRKNLITVPSCDEHNLKKSGDDEYLLAIMASHLEGNQIAMRQFQKIMRAMRRRSWLLPKFFNNLHPVNLGHIQTGKFYVDKERFDRSLDRIARGIYYHHYHKRIDLPSAIVSHSLVADMNAAGIETNTFLLNWRIYSTEMLANEPKYGENPAVYYYQMIEDKESTGVAIRHVFFEGVVADVVFGDIDVLRTN